MQEDTAQVASALQQADLDSAQVSEPERALLGFARLLTAEPWKTSDQDVAGLRAEGWNDGQIAEAVYVIALFAFFNRVADAFGLAAPDYAKIMGENTRDDH